MTARRTLGKPRLEALIEEAIVDAYGESEQRVGFLCMLQEHLACPSCRSPKRHPAQAILKDHGIEPAPERRTKTPWKTFLAAHWDGLAAADFFTIEVMTMAGLVR